jgi:hypothetical protein
VVIAVVADGHGNKDSFRSDRGSKFAVECAVKNIQIFIADISKEKLFDKRHEAELFRQLGNSIISDWYERVRQDYKADSFSAAELAPVSDGRKVKYQQQQNIEIAYGTTLMAAAATESYWFGLQIGDGKCVSIHGGAVCKQLIPWNDKCFLNATTSICDASASDEFRYCFDRELPAAVFVGTDGIDDSFQTSEQLYQLYKTIALDFMDKGIVGGTESLREYLPTLSKRGSGDDVSVAGILHLGRLREIKDRLTALTAPDGESGRAVYS